MTDCHQQRLAPQALPIPSSVSGGSGPLGRALTAPLAAVVTVVVAAGSSAATLE
jgi:hypothetical protein